MSDERRFLNIPIPDPSAVTGERLQQIETQLRREIKAERELLQSHIESTKFLSDERFDGILQRIGAVKEQLDTAIYASAEALRIALNAQKEAANESKETTSKQIEQVEKNISEIKELIYRGEGKSGGIGATIGMGAAILFGAGGMVISILTLVLHR